METISKRTQDSKTFDLGEGKFRSVIGGEVSHYKDIKGNWQDCKPTEKSTPPEGFTDFYKQINLPVAIDKDGNRRVYFSQKLDVWLDMGKLEPYDKADEKTYKVDYEITDKGTDFKLTLLNDKAPLKWKFKFNPRGVKYDNGKIEPSTSTKELAKLNDVFYWSEGKEDVKQIKFSFEKDYVVFEIDTKGMEYPIIVDPQVIINSPDADTHINSSAATTNYGSDTTIIVDRNFRFGLIRFDYSALPAGATITSAIASFYRNTSGTSANTIGLNRITNTGFVESQATYNIKSTGVDWNTAGLGDGTDYTSTDRADTLVGTAIDWYDWDITNQLITLGASRIYEGYIRSLETNNTVNFRSKENGFGNPPKLTIDYTTGAIYKSTGYAISPAIDMHAPVNWSEVLNNQDGGATPDDSTIAITIATSDDNVTYTGYGAIASALDSRFAKLKAMLNANTGATETPILNDIYTRAVGVADGTDEVIPSDAEIGKQLVDNGTAEGQMLFWDGTKWTYTETSELFFDDVNKRVGIGTATPSSTQQIVGSVSKSIVTKTSDYIIDSTDYTILLDGTSNTVTATLPTAVGIEGRIYNIKCIDDTYTVTVDANGSETIDGELTQVLNQWDNMKIQSDGSNWVIL